MKRDSWSARNAERIRLRGAAKLVGDGELRRSAETRERILDAAIRSMVEGGYRRLSVADVAERAGYTRAAAIYHFSTRESLLAAVISHLFDRRLALYWEAVRGVPEDASQIAAFVDIYWEQVTGDLFTAFVELLVAARTDPALAALIAPELERYENERRRYSEMIFSPAMRQAAGLRFEVIRDVARFLIEGMAFAATYSDVSGARAEAVKRFVIEQMQAAYRP
jgi:AcrR family transcriptional regulator